MVAVCRNTISHHCMLLGGVPGLLVFLPLFTLHYGEDDPRRMIHITCTDHMCQDQGSVGHIEFYTLVLGLLVPPPNNMT